MKRFCPMRIVARRRLRLLLRFRIDRAAPVPLFAQPLQVDRPQRHQRRLRAGEERREGDREEEEENEERELQVHRLEVLSQAVGGRESREESRAVAHAEASERPRSETADARGRTGSALASRTLPAEAAALRWIPRLPDRFSAVAPHSRRHWAGAHREPLARGSARGGPPGRRLVRSRAGLLADVAAEDVVADPLLDVIRDRAAVLDRPVGEASARVEDARLDEGLRRAGLQASDAGAASLGDRLVGRKVEVGQDLGEQEIGARLRIDQAAVLADPSQARLGRERPFGEGSRIHADAVAEAAEAVQRRAQRVRRAPAGCRGNRFPRRSARSSSRRRRQAGGSRGSGEADDRARAREEPFRGRPGLERPGEVAHGRVAPFADPPLEPVEAGGACARAKPIREKPSRRASSQGRRPREGGRGRSRAAC